jgi:UPF0755 protein
MNSHIQNIKNHFITELKELWDLISHSKPTMVFIILSILLTFFLIKIDTPRKFVPGTIVEIEEGSSVKQAAETLVEENIIKSSSIFNFYIQFSNNKTIAAGEYLFEEDANVFTVAQRLMKGDYGIPIKEVTLSEGMTVHEMGIRLASNFPKFNEQNFLNLALKYEGYLFPDTYRFSLNVDEFQIIETMRDNFNARLLPIREQIENSGKTLDEIITMASIVEKEATRETIQEVSNVLWHRMDLEMLLQVDATFVYSIDKNSFTVTKDEMRDESDEYNTYVHLGLPPTPISNPGMESILASINAEPTEYLFFLTGRDGEMYFAETFDGHKENRRRYLD